MGINMSKDKQQAANMNLQALPTEIVERIARKLDIASLGAFRTTSRTIQAKTTKAFAEAVVPDHTLPVRLTISGVQAALTELRFDDIAEQALHVYFRGGFVDLEGRPKVPIDREELKRLLRKLFERLQSLQSVDISYNSRRESQGPSEVMAILTEQPLPRLQTLKLYHLAIPVAHLVELLDAHRKTLKHVFFSDLCARDDPNDISWATLLAHIRDNMSLADLRIDHANDAREPYRSVLLNRDREHFTRVNRAMRDPGTRDISHYSFTAAQSNFYGQRAVKLGLNQLLQSIGSALYDPNIPEK